MNAVLLKNPPPGYASVVHQGLLKPAQIWKAPADYVLFNVLIAIFVCLWLTWRWLIVSALAHGVMMGFWAYDPHLLPNLVAHLRHRRYYGSW